jgi:hypothetical protein
VAQNLDFAPGDFHACRVKKLDLGPAAFDGLLHDFSSIGTIHLKSVFGPPSIWIKRGGWFKFNVNVITAGSPEAGYAADHARQFIEMSHYLLRGVFFVSTWLPYKIDRAEVIRAWRELAPAVLRVKPRKRINGKCPRPRASRGVRMD